MAGHSNVGISDGYSVSETLAKQPGLQKVLGGKTYHPFPVGWAVRKQDTDVLNFLNVALGELISSGKLREWALKYKAPWAEFIRY
ncbi:MAG: transporter substrate-binding domain-containing protein [Deltaproteobacteria bacterium]|nr:transporter substrate-binding domain-containing protein [Deltaproteobacteria bacterium]